eukprot:403377076
MKSVLSIIPLTVLCLVQTTYQNQFMQAASQEKQCMSHDLHINKRELGQHGLSYSGLKNFIEKQQKEERQNNSPLLSLSSIAGDDDDDNLITKTLEDFFDVQLFSTLYLGSRQEEKNVIFDTGSAWIWVCSENCEACRPQSRYSEGLSKTYRKVSDDPILITYGTGQVIGEQGTEKICLMKNSFCAENVSFLTVTDMSPDLSGLRADGILGMSPSKQATQADLLINELYSQGSIDEKVFSLYIQPEEKNSKITIGGYDLESFVKPDQNGVKKIYWHDLSNTNYWTLGLKKAFYGDHQLQPTVSNVIVDSGTSYMLIPTEDFKQFTDIMSDQYICGRQRAYNNLYACLCTDSEYETYPDFRIQIDDIQYSIYKENYVMRYSDKCIFKIMSMDFPRISRFWIMGLNFLHTYYTVFDQEQSRIGFAVSKNSNMENSIIDLTPVVPQQNISQASNETEQIQQNETIEIIGEEVMTLYMTAQQNQSHESNNLQIGIIVLISIITLYLCGIFILFMKGKIGVQDGKNNRHSEMSLQLLTGNFSYEKLASTNSSSSKFRHFYEPLQRLYSSRSDFKQASVVTNNRV